MHVTLITLMLATGANFHATVNHAGASGSPGTQVRGGGICRFGGVIGMAGGLFGGPMPQTCYSPRYGCYPGNQRDIHRYPAFHGTYYRRPYIYRNVFDFPWHAEPHEPASYFGHDVSGQKEKSRGADPASVAFRIPSSAGTVLSRPRLRGRGRIVGLRPR